MTLQQLSTKLGVHPYDLVGEDELADELMHEDITDTMFYQELLLAKCEKCGRETSNIVYCDTCLF